MRKSTDIRHRLSFICGAAAVISHLAVLMQAELSLGIHEKALPIQERPSQPLIANEFTKQ